MTPLRILIVDDHFIVRFGLAESLSLEPDMEIAGILEDGSSLCEAYGILRPSLVIMDWRLPGLAGSALISRLLVDFPAAKVLVLSAHEDEETVYQAIQSGAIGYVPKSARRAELIDAVRRAARGQNCVPPQFASLLADRMRRPALTTRETEVLRHLAAGNSNKEISTLLGISDNTVKLHISHILQKLSARDRAHAATIAFQRGLIL